MAQTIHCDHAGCDQVADIMISNMATGDTQAFCTGHYAEFVFNVATAMLPTDEDIEEAKAGEADVSETTTEQLQETDSTDTVGQSDLQEDPRD